MHLPHRGVTGCDHTLDPAASQQVAQHEGDDFVGFVAAGHQQHQRGGRVGRREGHGSGVRGLPDPDLIPSSDFSEQFATRLNDEALPGLGQDAPVAIFLGHQQGGNEDIFVKFLQGVFPNVFFGEVDHVIGFQRQHPLVELGRGIEHGLAAEQHAERAEARHIGAEYEHANCERSRQYQTRRAPEPRPEHRRQ